MAASSTRQDRALTGSDGREYRIRDALLDRTVSGYGAGAADAEASVSTAVEEGVRVAGGSMLAAVWHGADVIELEQQPVPAPQSGQVLVRILACGLCATDLHMLDGQFPLAVEPLGVGDGQTRK